MLTIQDGNGVCITGMGLVTSLGFGVVDSCAAARAGISRMRELNVLNTLCEASYGGEPITGHAIHEYSEGFVGVGKVILLGKMALIDLFGYRPLKPADWHRTAFYLNLSDEYFVHARSLMLREQDLIQEKKLLEEEPDLRVGAEDTGWVSPRDDWHSRTANVIQRLLDSVGVAPSPSLCHLRHGGQAGVVECIQEALRRIQSGEVDRCIVGGIGCCIEPQFLRAAADLGVLRTATNPTGFVPGEAAGFILLEGVRHTTCAGSCRLLSAAVYSESIHRLSEEPPTGLGLARAIEALSSQGLEAPQPYGFLVGNLNGDEYRARDWGYAIVRLHDSRPIGDVPLWIPALSFGETGAATGAVSACLVARAFQRGYSPSGSALVWIAADDGKMAALALCSN